MSSPEVDEIKLAKMERKPLDVEGLLDFAHIRHYPWGKLYMSQGFYEETGLMPLTPDTNIPQAERQKHKKSGDPTFRIFLIAASEAEVFGLQPQDELTFQVDPRIYKKSVDIVVASNGSMEKSKASLIETVVDATDGHFEELSQTEILEEVRGPLGEPAREYIDQEITEIYLDSLLDGIVVPAVKKGLWEWVTLTWDKKFLRRMIGDSAAAVLTSGGFAMYLNWAEMPHNPRGAVIAWLGMASVALTSIGQDFRDILRDKRLVAATAAKSLNGIARGMVGKIYWDFSREGFRELVDPTLGDLGIDEDDA